MTHKAPTLAVCCNDDCSQGRACPERLPRKHTCDELGVCQGGVPNLHPFAPGAIDGPHGSGLRLTVRRALTELAALSAAISVVGFCAGYLATRLGLLS